MRLHWVTALSVFGLIFSASLMSQPPVNSPLSTSEFVGP